MIVSALDVLHYPRGEIRVSARAASQTEANAQNQSEFVSDRGVKISTKPDISSLQINERDRALIDRAFETASIGVGGFVAADMKARILEGANVQTYTERALILRFQSAQALGKSSVDEAVKAQNLILASRGEPPITPAEERKLEGRIYAVIKQRIAFLDAFVGAMEAKSVKIRS
ncbi:MAG: hypothetical protein LBO72_10675 [Helicobacteraceae bacterium]|nr:hypothetical protein [Helicobacteraceae bacterium]